MKVIQTELECGFRFGYELLLSQSGECSISNVNSAAGIWQSKIEPFWRWLIHNEKGSLQL